MDDPVPMLRMVERIVAVLIGGVSIYLGYRLFSLVPYRRSDKGELELPGVRLVLSRVGPGVFFAAFGTVVLYYSLTNPVETGGGFVGASAEAPAAVQPPQGAAMTPQERGRALVSIEMLNCAERMLLAEMDDESLQAKLSVGIRDAKRTLLLAAWQPSDWGPPDQLGLAGPRDGAPLEVRSRWQAAYAGCPR